MDIKCFEEQAEIRVIVGGLRFVCLDESFEVCVRVQQCRFLRGALGIEIKHALEEKGNFAGWRGNGGGHVSGFLLAGDGVPSDWLGQCRANINFEGSMKGGCCLGQRKKG